MLIYQVLHAVRSQYFYRHACFLIPNLALELFIDFLQLWHFRAFIEKYSNNNNSNHDNGPKWQINGPRFFLQYNGKQDQTHLSSKYLSTKHAQIVYAYISLSQKTCCQGRKIFLLLKHHLKIVCPLISFKELSEHCFTGAMCSRHFYSPSRFGTPIFRGFSMQSNKNAQTQLLLQRAEPSKSYFLYTKLHHIPTQEGAREGRDLSLNANTAAELLA